MQCFKGKGIGNVFKRLATLVVAQASNVTVEPLLGFFLGILTQEIKCWLRSHDPGDVTQALRLAT